MAFCTNCGHTLGENQKFCTKCGNLVNSNPNSAPIQSEKTEEKPYEAPIKNVMENITPITPVNKTPERPPIQPQESYAPVQKSSSVFKRPWVTALLLIVCILAVLTGVFFKQVKGGYYLVRYNLENDTIKKFEYAAQSISNLNISSTYNAYIASSKELIKQNPNKVEAKLDSLKTTIKPEDYKELKISLCNERITASVTLGKYDEALLGLVKLQEYGGNIKENSKYEIIMLNLVAANLGTSVYNDKAALKEKANIIIDNLDEDAFDEIIEIKDLNPKEYFEKQYDINLYKLKNNKYTKVDSQQTLPYNYLVDYGIYNYDKNKKGLYVSITETGYVSSASVYKINAGEFALVGTVDSSDPCAIQDFDNDGIFEVSTTELYDPYNKYSHADMPRITRFYKFSDGSKPRVAKEDKPVIGSSVAIQPSTEYIFQDSDKRYLSESEVSVLSKEQLAYARNEIYARHGYVFNTDKYVQYFSSKSWYKANPNFVASDSNLNQYEIKNYTLIQKYEK